MSMRIGGYDMDPAAYGRGQSSKPIINPGESEKVAPGRKSSPAECETCKSRKYQDGSDEMVSFKTAAHISPGSSAAKVMSHEREHVSNAYEKASQKEGRVVQASVSLQTDTCPECGRSYVSGGQTTTTIAYQRDGQKTQEEQAVGGQMDVSA